MNMNPNWKSRLDKMPVVLIALLSLCCPVKGDDLEALLKPDKAAVLSDDADARNAWNGVVEAFRKSDFNEAKRRGDAFLAAAYQATTYQVLGVQVMLSLSEGEEQARTVLDKKSSNDIANLEKEHQSILTRMDAQRRIDADALAVINRLTNNRTVGVQQGSSNYNICMQSRQQMLDAEAAIKDLETSNRQIETQLQEKKQLANEHLHGDILRLLQMLRDANEIPAAFAIANVYLRRVGTDLDVAKLQQDFVRLMKINNQAVKIVDLIHSKQRPFVEKMEYWAAQKEADNMLVTVRSQAEDAELPALVDKLMGADPFFIQSKKEKADSQASAINKLAETDHSVASAKLDAFRHDFPDYPDTAQLEGKILGERSIASKEASEKLVTEIEHLAEESPEQAMQLLKTLDEKSLPSTEQQRLGVRIKVVTNKVCHSMLDSMDADIHSAAELLGGLALNLIANGSANEKVTEVLRSKALDLRYKEQLRINVDKSAEKPKAAAMLSRVLATVSGIKLMQLDHMQQVHLEGIEAQAKLLLEACK